MKGPYTQAFEDIFKGGPLDPRQANSEEELEPFRKGIGAGPVGKDTNPKDAIGDTKVPLWLLSSVAKIHWALAQFAGQIKYGSWNWRAAGIRTSVYLSALERHLEAYKNGEEYDPVDGTHHLGNIMACAAIILDAQAAGKLNDDRPPIVSHRPTLTWAEKLMTKLKEQYKDKAPRHYTIADVVVPTNSKPD